MFDEDRPHVVKKNKLDVKILLSTGEDFRGSVYLRKHERVIDLMNDDRSFIPISIDDDVIKVVNKTAIAEISIIVDFEKNVPDFPDFNVPDASNYALSLTQAMAVFGIKAGYTRQEVSDHHKKLVSRLHPDIGGSDFLTGQLNAARDILVRELSKAERSTGM